MGRRGDGAWVDRAARLAARLEASDVAGRRLSLAEAAGEAKLSVAMARRYADAYDHVGGLPPDAVSISLNAFEHLKTWTKVDPIGATAAR